MCETIQNKIFIAHAEQAIYNNENWKYTARNMTFLSFFYDFQF